MTLQVQRGIGGAGMIPTAGLFHLPSAGSAGACPLSGDRHTVYGGVAL